MRYELAETYIEKYNNMPTVEEASIKRNPKHGAYIEVRPTDNVAREYLLETVDSCPLWVEVIKP